MGWSWLRAEPVPGRLLGLEAKNKMQKIPAREPPQCLENKKKIRQLSGTRALWRLGAAEGLMCLRAGVFIAAAALAGAMRDAISALSARELCLLCSRRWAVTARCWARCCNRPREGGGSTRIFTRYKKKKKEVIFNSELLENQAARQAGGNPPGGRDSLLWVAAGSVSPWHLSPLSLQLWKSDDFGQTWIMIQEHVKSFSWYVSWLCVPPSSCNLPTFLGVPRSIQPCPSTQRQPGHRLSSSLATAAPSSRAAPSPPDPDPHLRSFTTRLAVCKLAI